MGRITISKSAVGKLIGDLKIRHDGSDEPGCVTPLLYYYHRSFSTLNDGTVIQHGDGFMLAYVNSEKIRKAEDITYEAVAIVDGFEIIVGGPRSLMSSNFTIGCANGKFTFEP